MVRKPPLIDLPSFPQASTQTSKESSTPPSTSVSYTVSCGEGADAAALPFLPKSKRPSFSSHRNDANAALALDLLNEVQTAIAGWHQALQDTLLAMQTLYMAGPIVDGWLESISHDAAQSELDDHAAILRHGDPAQVANYIEKLSQQAVADMSGRAQYRLCSLNADGEMQCQVCPPEQLGIISQAIARNQQLRQLVSQKQYLEAKLKRAAEALEVTRRTLDIRGQVTEPTA
jgi:hypothetical protein